MTRLDHWKESIFALIAIIARLLWGALALRTLRNECKVAASRLPANLRAVTEVFFFGAAPTASPWSAGRPFRAQPSSIVDTVPLSAADDPADGDDDADAEDSPGIRAKRKHSQRPLPPFLSVAALPPTALVVPFVNSSTSRPAWPNRPVIEESDSSATLFTAQSIPRRHASRRRHGKVLVLDLDDTLICSATSATRYGVSPTYCEAVATASGAELFHIWERPDVHTFLRCVAEWYNVAVFTAASVSYANPIIDRLDPSRKLIRRRYFRNDCTAAKVGGSAMSKDLTKLGVPLQSVVLLDNCLDSLRLQPDNGLLLVPFTPPPPSLFATPGPASPRVQPDNVLIAVLPFLEALSHVRDVRSVLRFQSR